MKKLPDLVIGDLKINPPIIQGGMGVRVSKFGLASAVSNTGALGVLSSVGLGLESESEIDYERSSSDALKEQILETKKRTKNPFGVNIMCALTNYESLVNTCINNKVDVIISGAGIPLKLPQYAGDSNTKLVPIVSSAKAAYIICSAWLKRFNRLPDALIVEGPKAGGHLGFSRKELSTCITLEIITSEVIERVKEISNGIPIIAAGGIFNGKDIAKFLKIGASGVQMATRFVCTYECDASDAYKETYLKAKEEDIIIIDSPVGLPGRVIKNKFVERILKGEKIKFKCPYKCLKTCDAMKVNYCIADALVNASKGDMENGFAMCGQNAYKIDKIVSVQELIDELVEETEEDFLK